MAASLLMFAACCGENGGSATTGTPVEYGAEIVLEKVSPKAGLTINESLANRMSWREYSAEKLSLEELSGVMWAAAGVNRADGKLTAPSALALYPVSVYAVFEQGTYRYDAVAHKLVRVADGDLRKMTGVQDFVATAALNILYVADMSVYEGRGIPEEKVRYLCGQDAAGYAENVNLFAAGHGLRSITRGSFDPSVLTALGISSSDVFVALAQSVGK